MRLIHITRLASSSGHSMHRGSKSLSNGMKGEGDTRLPVGARFGAGLASAGADAGLVCRAGPRPLSAALRFFAFARLKVAADWGKMYPAALVAVKPLLLSTAHCSASSRSITSDGLVTMWALLAGPDRDRRLHPPPATIFAAALSACGFRHPMSSAVR